MTKKIDWSWVESIAWALENKEARETLLNAAEYGRSLEASELRLIKETHRWCEGVADLRKERNANPEHKACVDEITDLKSERDEAISILRDMRRANRVGTNLPGRIDKEARDFLNAFNLHHPEQAGLPQVKG